ncbi:DUF7302 family protein [Arthrobacter woluwensis]|nr:hypothetical protein [Arthrobacter woluwensis]
MSRRMIDTYTGSTVVDDELAESLGSQYVPEDEYEAPAGRKPAARKAATGRAAKAKEPEGHGEGEKSEDE